MISSSLAAASARRRRARRRAASRPSRATSPASTACASSPPWLACSQSSQKRCARCELASLRPPPCPGRRRPSATRAGPGGSVPSAEQHLVAGRDGDDDVGRERLLERRRDVRSRARARPARARVPSTSQTRDRATARDERPRGGAAVHAGADHRRRRRIGARRASRPRAPPRRRCAARSPTPRRAPPAARPSRRPRRARRRSPSAGPAPGCRGTR